MNKSIVYCAIMLILIIAISGCVQQGTINQATQNQNNQNQMDGIENETKVEPLNEHQNAQLITYGDNYRGYLVTPKRPGEFPGVVLIHEWWGLNDNIKQEANNLAKEGYVVLAVDLYNGQVAATSDKARELAGAARSNPQPAIDQMKAGADYLRSHERVSGKVASMGWCFGGGMAMQHSLNDDLDATVIYYGTLETDKQKLSTIDWPVLGIFGSEDQSIPLSSVGEFDKSLDSLGIENEIYIYDGVGHAFANPSNAGHDQAKTKDAWDKTVLFLNKHLKT